MAVFDFAPKNISIFAVFPKIFRFIVLGAFFTRICAFSQVFF